MESFSEGEKQIWSIIKLFLNGENLFILDEPMNHLDILMRIYLEDITFKEKRKGKAFLIVSHDRVFIDRVADKTLYIKRGESVVVNGGYSQMIKHLKNDFQSKKKKSDEIQQKIIKLEHAAMRLGVWTSRKEKEKIGSFDKGFIGARSAKLAKRAKITKRRKEKMIKKLKKEKPFIERKIRLSFPLYSVSNRHMLSAKNLYKQFDNNVIFQNVNLELITKDRIAIIGLNGSGKTTLLLCLLGLLKVDKGNIYKNDNVRLIHIPQNIRTYFKKEILLDNLMVYGLEESIVRQYLGAAKLRGEKVLQPISTLSRGELMRAAIVSTILSKAEFLFLDEPTNHLDIESLEVLDQLINEYPGGMLFISHDRHFITKHAQEIFSIHKKKLISYNF